jgi:phage terminase large subunit-like protein
MARPRRSSAGPAGPGGRVAAAEVIGFIEEFCVIPSGMLAGKPVHLASFQREFLELIYDNPAGPTRRAILSTARKNAKTGLSACLLLNHLCGPSARNRPNSQLYSCAMSLDQAGLIFNMAAQMIKLNLDLARAVKVVESRKMITCSELGTVYKALSADANNAHGLSPQFCVFDELGRCKGPRSALYTAMESGAAAIEDPLTVVISTQAESPADLMSVLLQDGLSGQDPRTVAKLYCASETVDPYSDAALQMANPAWAYFQNREELRAEAAKARRMPAFASSYKNLTLNMCVESAAPFISRPVWEACAGPSRDLRGLPVYVGLDLSGGGDLTALVIVHPDPATGLWHIEPRFWLPEDRIQEHVLGDKVPYDLWIEAELVKTMPGSAIDFSLLAEEIRDIFDEFNVCKLAFDRWGFPNLRQWLIKAGFSEAMLKERFAEFPQTYVHMSPAVLALETLLLNAKIRHDNNPVMNWNMSNLVMDKNSVGERKPTKKKSTGRIDAGTALIMAIGVAPQGRTADFDPTLLVNWV